MRTTAGGAAGRYDRAFDGALHGALAVHRRGSWPSAPYRWAELAAHPPLRLELLARNHPGVDDRWLAAHLVEEVERRLAGDAGVAQARELADLAVRLAAVDDAADPGADHAPETNTPKDHDLAARAWRARADAQRLAGELAAAEASLLRARHHLERGGGAPLEDGLYHESRGRLLAARGRRGPAVLALRRAARLMRSVGERRAEGRVRLVAGLLLARDPAPRRWEALVELTEGLRRMDGDGTPPELARLARRRLARLNREMPCVPLLPAAPPTGRAATRSSAPFPAAGSPPAR